MSSSRKEEEFFRPIEEQAAARTGKTQIRRREMARAEKLLELGKLIQSELDPDKLLLTIVDSAIELAGAERGFLILEEVAEPESVLSGAVRFRVSRNARKQDIRNPRVEVSRSVVREALDSEEVVLSSNLQDDVRFASASSVKNLQIRSILAVPFRMTERTRGLIYLDCRERAGIFSPEDISCIRSFSELVSISMQNACRYRDSIRDRLTGLFAHNHFSELLRQAAASALNAGEPLSVVVFDVDRFKLVSDVHGYTAGNAVLEALGRILREATAKFSPTCRGEGEPFDSAQGKLRKSASNPPAGGLSLKDRDAAKESSTGPLLGRLGPDEFEVALPGLAKRDAFRWAEKIRGEIQKSALPAGEQKIYVTVASGVATLPEDAPDADRLAARAIDALYEAKRGGRNRVFAFGLEPEPSARSEVWKGLDLESIVFSRDGLNILGMLTRVTESGLELEPMVRLVVDMLVEVTGADRGLASLREPDGRWGFRAAKNLAEAEMAEPAGTPASQAFEIPRKVIEEVATKAEALLVADLETDVRFKRMLSDKSPRSIVCVPVRTKERLLAVIYLDVVRSTKIFTEEDLLLLIAFSRRIAVPLESSRKFAQELEDMKRMYWETRREFETRYRYDNILGRSEPMRQVFLMLDRIIDTSFPVVILGETGTGKELIARAIHANGLRKNAPFFAENCAAIPHTLLENELFGYVRGAFTGADRDRKGIFELAHGGTLFLDEIGDMDLDMQKKLLRALEEREIRPLGSNKVIKVDVRIICASNKDIKSLVEQGHFREDLFYRLSVMRIYLPPLRERKEDVPLLVEHFLEEACRELRREKPKVDPEAMRALLEYHWPGNVRELRNVLQRAAALVSGPAITRREILLEGKPPALISGGSWTAARDPSTSFRAGSQPAASPAVPGPVAPEESRRPREGPVPVPGPEPEAGRLVDYLRVLVEHRVNGVLEKSLKQTVLERIEARSLQIAMDQAKGNKTKACHALGIIHSTLRNKLKRYEGAQFPPLGLPDADKALERVYEEVFQVIQRRTANLSQNPQCAFDDLVASIEGTLTDLTLGKVRGNKSEASRLLGIGRSTMGRRKKPGSAGILPA